MDRIAIEELEAIVAHEVQTYSQAHGYKSQLYYLENVVEKTYSVIVVPDDDFPLDKKTNVVLFARIIGDYIVIEIDITNKPLVDALVHNGGIPRDKIILRYEGETLPENVVSPESPR